MLTKTLFSLSKSRITISIPVPIFVAIVLVLYIISSFFLTNTKSTTIPPFFSSLSRQSLNSQSKHSTADLPPLFIYRRTKKTGSSSMLNELLKSLVPLGYTPLYFSSKETDIIVRHEFITPRPRLLFVAEHNHITRSFHPQRRAVIADTVRDGYAQMTSFCRFVLNVQSCTDGVAKCLRSSKSLSQIHYRWGGATEEDDDTYIDLPLSSAHPALSTSVMRTIIPDISLDVSTFNVKNSSCPEIPELRKVYDELYGELDKQNLALKRRLLRISGYPITVHSNTPSEMTVDDMLDAAELIERGKYHLSENARVDPSEKSTYSNLHIELIRSSMAWTRDKDGKISLTTRRGI